MDLHKWLLHAKISQRELARRIGYATNGPLSKIISGKAYVPPDDIPMWADKLELTGDDRDRFIAEASRQSLPEWVWSDISRMRKRLKIQDEILGTGVPVDPRVPDVERLGDEDARRLALYRRAHHFTGEKIAEMEGRKPRPRMKGGDPR